MIISGPVVIISPVPGTRNPFIGGWHQPYNGASSASVGEALTHVQGESLKVNAAVLSRFVNSPAAGGIPSGGQFHGSREGEWHGQRI